MPCNSDSYREQGIFVWNNYLCIMAEHKKKNAANEPLAEYRKPDVQFFNSFEEMNESQYRYWLSLTPEQRLAQHYNLIMQIYKDEIAMNKKSVSNDIYFSE
jgi:hypothetical protein